MLICIPGLYPEAAELRLKTFGSQSWLDDSDIGARLHDDRPASADAELRYMAGFKSGAWQGQWHHVLVWQGGDGLAFERESGRLAGLAGTDVLHSPSGDDDTRLIDLAGTLDHGNRHRLTHRVDRLNLQIRGETWSATVGREALSLGGGILFHPMDFLSPFAPAAVDRDYKAGEDLLHVHRQLAGGGEVSFLAVGRRDATQHITRDAASFAVRGRGQIGAVEVEGLIAEHRDAVTSGFGVRLPVGEALLRADLVLSRTDHGWSTSGVLNMDRSFEIGGRNLYGFVEYYHNGFGVKRLAPGLPLPEALQERLAHGELYTLMRDYAGVGASIQWHPLVTQSLTVVHNFSDGSQFVQGSLQVDLSDSQNLEAGVLVLAGEDGEEFGGKPIALDPAGELVTAGSGVRFWLRWTWFPRFASLNRS